jgi:F0F1-type ATP synthase assembly protein I
MVGSIILGLVLGLWIDSHFGTKPWGTLVLSLLGIILGSIVVFRLVAQSIDQAAVETASRKKGKSPEDDGPFQKS